MTEDEKRRQKADLLLEHQEATENLAHLRERARGIGRTIRSIATWVEQKIGDERRTHDYASNDEAMRAQPEHVLAALNGEEVLSVMDELHKAEEKVKDLATRKAALGLK